MFWRHSQNKYAKVYYVEQLSLSLEDTPIQLFVSCGTNKNKKYDYEIRLAHPFLL